MCLKAYRDKNWTKCVLLAQTLLAVLGKLLGKCSELSYKLLYMKLSFTTPKLLPREM